MKICANGAMGQPGLNTELATVFIIFSSLMVITEYTCIPPT